jgi:hypothetical protein
VSSSRLSRHLVLWSVGISVVLFLALILLGHRFTRTDWETNGIHPVALRVSYLDDKTFSGESGIFHQGIATYTFKNTIPLPVKFAFPPIGYVFGGEVPFTPQCNDIERMPEFCREAQVIELEPNAERQFQARYTITTNKGFPHAPTVRFILGNPAGLPDKDLVIDAVQAVAEFQTRK